ncbi:MAG: GIY-YIG nuclease family protein [Thermoplasmatota archaeon]
MTMGRLPKYREFLHTLRDIVGLEGAAFAKAIGKKTSNTSQYLSGAKKPGKRTLHGAVYHLGEWNVTPIFELDPLPKLSEIPETPGIYALYDSSSNLIYAGQATNLRAELRQTLRRKTNFPIRSGPKLSEKANPEYQEITMRLSAYQVNSVRLRHNLEALLLRMLPNQSHNNKLGNFK